MLERIDVTFSFLFRNLPPTTANRARRESADRISFVGKQRKHCFGNSRVERRQELPQRRDPHVGVFIFQLRQINIGWIRRRARNTKRDNYQSNCCDRSQDGWFAAHARTQILKNFWRRIQASRALFCRRQSGGFPGLEAAGHGANVFVAHLL